MEAEWRLKVITDFISWTFGKQNWRCGINRTLSAKVCIEIWCFWPLTAKSSVPRLNICQILMRYHYRVWNLVFFGDICRCNKHTVSRVQCSEVWLILPRALAAFVLLSIAPSMSSIKQFYCNFGCCKLQVKTCVTNQKLRFYVLLTRNSGLGNWRVTKKMH